MVREITSSYAGFWLNCHTSNTFSHHCHYSCALMILSGSLSLTFLKYLVRSIFSCPILLAANLYLKKVQIFFLCCIVATWEKAHLTTHLTICGLHVVEIIGSLDSSILCMGCVDLLPGVCSTKCTPQRWMFCERDALPAICSTCVRLSDPTVSQIMTRAS